MSELTRRSFLKIMGQGPVVLVMGGMGLSEEVLAQSGGAQALKASYDEWEFFYPGKYDAQGAKIIDAIQAKLEQVKNHGDVDIDDLVSGKLDNKSTPVVSWNPMENNFKVTPEDMKTQAYSYVGENPLFTDEEYAKRTKHGAMAFPLVLTLEVFPMPKTDGLGDYMVGSAHNDVIRFYRPIYEGDTLFTVYDEQHFVDITPASGSLYRTFALIGSGRTFNQKGELVAEGANTIKEAYRRHKDPAKRNKGGAAILESHRWWDRKAHVYTDEDWEYITGIWRNEKVRGHETIFWDDVKIGDELDPYATAPILSEVETDMIAGIPQWCTDIKKNMLNPKTFAKMVKNKQGIYVMPEYLEKKPKVSMPGQEGGGSGGKPSGDRAVLQNAVLPKFAAGMFCNWMGDEGWLEKIGWVIIPKTRYPESVIPPVPEDLYPSLFDDKYPYLDKVPYMKGCCAFWHALEGDLFIFRAYVMDKYKKDGEYFVDFIWWCQTLDKYLVEEGFATVKLPKK